MPRIAGIELPRNKRVERALPYINGVGPARSREILKALNINFDKRTDALTDEEVAGITAYIENHFKVEGDLKREISMNVKRLMDLGTYRGMRHRKGLPSRGQRTRSNARTRKGPRKMPIAAKKKATA